MKSNSKFAVSASLAIVLAWTVGCVRDPNVKKQQYFESGKQYLQQGKYPEAAIQFQNAIQIDKDFAEGHSQLAQCFLHQGLWIEAYRELTLTIALEPRNWQAQSDLASLFFGARQFQEARARAESILKEDPSQVSAQLLLANSDAELGNIQAALQEAQQAVDMAPDKPAAYLSVAFLQENNHQPLESEHSFQKAISLDPKFLPSRLGFGSYYQRQQRWTEAEAQYRAAVEIAPVNPLPRASLASFYFAWGKKDQAERILQDAKKAKPNDPSWYRMLGDFYLLNHDTEKALAEFGLLRQEHPGDLNVKKFYIQILIQNRQFVPAMSLNEEILKQNPKDAEALTLKGQALNLDQKFAESTPILEAAVRSNPDAPLARFQLGMAYSKSGNVQGAEKEWRETVKLKPSMLEAQQELATLALRKDDVDLLSQTASAWLNYAPTAPQGYVLRGMVRLKKGDLPGAEEDLQQAIALDSKSAIVYTRLGDVRFLQKRFTQAEQLYEQALEYDPRAIEALQELVKMFLYQKQSEKALRRVQMQVTKVPDDAAYHILLGQMLLSDHKALQSQPEFKKAAELDGVNLIALFLLAQAQQEAHQADDATLTYERLLRENSKNPEACVVFGVFEERRGNWRHAEELYRKALDLQTSQPTAANNLSYLLLEHGGDTNYALSLAQIARRGMPESANTADTLAWAYYKNGIYNSAIDLLREATKSVPQNPTYQYHLGLAYQKSNQAELAKASFQRALALDPKSPRAAEIREALTELTTN